jgi:hypothetical protein
LRPPFGYLDEVLQEDHDDDRRRLRRTTAFELTRAAIEVLAGIEPFESRRQAMLRLYDSRAADPERSEFDRNGPAGDLYKDWAEHADDEVVAELPELAGPVGHLEWVGAGLVAAHERLLEAVPDGQPLETGLAQLLLASGLTTVPAELVPAFGRDRYDQIADRVARAQPDFAARRWSQTIRAWLSGGLIAGEIDTCRAWLDMASRFSASVVGLPGNPVRPNEDVLPVSGFQQDVRQIFRPRRVARNPLVVKLAGRPRTDHSAKKDKAARAAAEVGTELVGQSELVTVLREIAADTEATVRLLIAGPDGTGKRDAAQEIERILVEREGMHEGIWVSENTFSGMSVFGAVAELQGRIE